MISKIFKADNSLKQLLSAMVEFEILAVFYVNSDWERIIRSLEVLGESIHGSHEEKLDGHLRGLHEND